MSFSEILGVKIVGKSLPGSIGSSLRRKPNVPGKTPVDGDGDGMSTGPDGRDNVPVPKVPRVPRALSFDGSRKRRRDRLPVREGRVRDRELWDEEGFDRDPEINEDRRFNQDRARDDQRRRGLDYADDNPDWYYDDDD